MNKNKHLLIVIANIFHFHPSANLKKIVLEKKCTDSMTYTLQPQKWIICKWTLCSAKREERGNKCVFVLWWHLTLYKSSIFSTWLFVPELCFFVLIVFISILTNKLSEMYYVISHSILDVKMSNYTIRSPKVPMKQM